jgi:homoserine O-acetyltransferase/O-succinyltransferase
MPMKTPTKTLWLAGLAACLTTLPAAAQYPTFQEGSFIIKDFRFQNGQVLPEMKVAYITIGKPTGIPVLLIHGTAGSAKGMLAKDFADELFAPGKALDAEKYFIIMPDTIGAGGSSKPSDGLRAQFPSYNFADMVTAQKTLVSDHLKIPRLRLVIGNSMGGMVSWQWGVQHPDFMDALVPMASVPGPMAGRNWMLRRMVIDSVKSDPAWQGGNYTTQPPNLRLASAWFPKADACVDERIAGTRVGDANDTMYQWDASRHFDPTPELNKIKAAVLAINSEDDERNPPQLDLMKKGLERIGHGEVYMIPATDETTGHGTTFSAKHYEARLKAFLERVPVR